MKTVNIQTYKKYCCFFFQVLSWRQALRTVQWHQTLSNMFSKILVYAHVSATKQKIQKFPMKFPVSPK